MERDRSVVRVEQAAKILGVSVRTLERRFREYVGVSPKWVVRRYRLIDAAVRLQRDPGTRIARLAAELGYADQAHFTRDFKAMIGRTPGAFTRDTRTDPNP